MIAISMFAGTDQVKVFIHVSVYWMTGKILIQNKELHLVLTLKQPKLSLLKE
jgi:hypothetical protein